MTSPRGVRAVKGRTVLYLAALLCTISVFYLYQAYNQNYENTKLLHHNCLAEQTSLSSQLQAVVEYKSRLEQSLTAEKQALSALRNHDQRERDTLTSRLGNLQDLFDTLTLECNKVEKSAQEEQALLRRYRESLSEVERNLNQKVKELENENQLLRDKNQKLMYTSNSPPSHSYPRVQTENKNISKQVEIAPDVFKLNINSNSFQAQPLQGQVNQLKESVSKKSPSSSNVGFLKQNMPWESLNHSVPVSPSVKSELGNPNARPMVPDGFAPELFVHDSHKALDKAAYQSNKGTPEKLVVKPPNRYEVKLGEDKVLENLDIEKKVESALERLSPPLDDKFHNPNKISDNDHYGFQEMNNNNLPVEGQPKKQRANINDNADFNDVNISIDQAEPAMANHFEQEDDDNEDYDNNKLDFQAANRN